MFFSFHCERLTLTYVNVYVICCPIELGHCPIQTDIPHVLFIEVNKSYKCQNFVSLPNLHLYKSIHYPDKYFPTVRVNSPDPDSNADPRKKPTLDIGPLEKPDIKYEKPNPRKNRTSDIRPLEKPVSNLKY